MGSLHIGHEKSVLMSLEEQVRTRLFGHDIGHESLVLMLAEEQDRMRLWEAIQPAVILDGIFYS